ncbi:hypothetical protein [Streptomyces ziwulingensis]|uniref:NUDIX hydrolase n=1 Tax=Streptomyces ziwulingensis TaxID=1045501 RepID=A0ABP9BYQ2_9ACTN
MDWKKVAGPSAGVPPWVRARVLPPQQEPVPVQPSICFLGHPVAGQLAVSDESTAVRWFEPSEVVDLPMVESIRKRVDDWRSGAMPALR